MEATKVKCPHLPLSVHSSNTKPPTTLFQPWLHLINQIEQSGVSCPTTMTWGHELSSINVSDTLWFLLQNPNGLKLNPLDMGDFAYGMHIGHQMGAGILGFCETNINWNHIYLQNRAHCLIRDTWHKSSVQFSQQLEPFHQQCQRGGTLQIATDRWSARLQSKGVNPYGLGRWSYMILSGKVDRKVSVITAFRVCKSTFDSAGDTTCFMQQYRSILAQYNKEGKQYCNHG